MQVFIYDIGIRIFLFYLWVVSLFNNKAKEFLRGRKNWKNSLSKLVSENDRWIWFHSASLGEFEQGKPLIEEIKKQYPQYKLLLSFFSPSGYTVSRNYEHADAIVYMPVDTKANAEFFVNTLKPVLAVFIKYEFWFHHLDQLKKNSIKTILVSGVFRKDQPFFQWYGGIFKRMLRSFTTVFVQDDRSKNLLSEIGITKNVIISGDTRYDRVDEIATRTEKTPAIEKFIADSKIFIAGSTWPRDEQVIHECLDVFPQNWKIIIAPHEIDEKHLNEMNSLFREKMIFYSQLRKSKEDDKNKVLVIDNIGMLSKLYAYGDIAYVGGGFQKSGIHNVLEPAVFGLPVIFGPHFRKFIEATELKDSGFAYSINSASDFKYILQQLIEDEAHLLKLRSSIREHMTLKTGASDVITGYILQSGWL